MKDRRRLDTSPTKLNIVQLPSRNSTLSYWKPNPAQALSRPLLFSSLSPNNLLPPPLPFLSLLLLPLTPKIPHHPLLPLLAHPILNAPALLNQHPLPLRLLLLLSDIPQSPCEAESNNYHEEDRDEAEQNAHLCPETGVRGRDGRLVV
jgi:hypothetical protein